MMSNIKSDILILYSNPSDTPRIRLDKEYRVIDKIIERFDIDPRRITRLHATSVNDFVAELQKGDFEIIQFSGHGSGQGIYLESYQIKEREEVSAQRVAAILRGTSPKLKAIIFMSCFSASSIQDLIDIAPYLITVFGEADDKYAIEFVRRFYESFLKHGSVEQAFETSVRLIGALLEDKGIHPILSRRAQEKGNGRFLVQAFPSSGDSILIDLTDVEGELSKLGVPREKFLSILTRKIRAHQWVFGIPRERVVLPIGSYFGIFSWQNASDLVTCDHILQLKENVDEATCKMWTRLVLNYNDLFSAKYRSIENPTDPTALRSVEVGFKNLRKFYDEYFLNENNAKILKGYLGRTYNSGSALIDESIDFAEKKYYQEDYETTIRHMEIALTTIHDIVDVLTEELCE